MTKHNESATCFLFGTLSECRDPAARRQDMNPTDKRDQFTDPSVMMERSLAARDARIAELERQLAEAQKVAGDLERELLAESAERIKAHRRADEILSELIHLEQAYSNRHSPQHRAAALNSAQVKIAAIDAARGKG